MRYRLYLRKLMHSHTGLYTSLVASAYMRVANPVLSHLYCTTALPQSPCTASIVLLLPLYCRPAVLQAPRKVVHVDIRPQPSMSGSPKNPIGVGVVADVGDFVGVLLQYLYGLLEERARTLSGESLS